jgi:hypothetical protein
MTSGSLALKDNQVGAEYHEEDAARDEPHAYRYDGLDNVSSDGKPL